MRKPVTIERQLKYSKGLVMANLKTIRCHLQMNLIEFAKLTETGKRGLEFESGRFMPSIEEIELIAKHTGISANRIIYDKLYTKIFSI